MNLRWILPVAAGMMLSGCAGSDLAEINQKISDFGFSVTGNTPTDGTKPVDANTGKVTSDEKKEYSIPVDVDTAAARLRRYYQFVSNKELESIRSKGRDGSSMAAAIAENHFTWEETPGVTIEWGKTGKIMTMLN